MSTDPRRDPTCLIWLTDARHACRGEDGRPIGADGGHCATWARVRATRNLAAVARSHERDRYQLTAIDGMLALLAEARHLLDATIAFAECDERFATVWAKTAVALLRADQAVMLAGWDAGASSTATPTRIGPSSATPPKRD